MSVSLHQTPARFFQSRSKLIFDFFDPIRTSCQSTTVSWKTKSESAEYSFSIGPNHDCPKGVTFLLLTTHSPLQLEQSQFQPVKSPVSKLPFLILPLPARPTDANTSSAASPASEATVLRESLLTSFSSLGTRCRRTRRSRAG